MIIRELKDPRISPMTSVTEAIVTPDLKFCTVYFSVFGDDASAEDTLKGLEAAKGFVRKELAGRINLRITPELIFKRDNSLEYGIHMSKLIDEVIEKDNERASEEN